MEIKELVKENCKAYEIEDWTTVCAESEDQALDWYISHFEPDSAKDDISCWESELDHEYYINEEQTEFETIAEGIEKKFKEGPVTEPFILCTSDC